MKKLLTLLLTLILTVGACMGLTACGREKDPEENKSDLAMGKEMVKQESQLDALVQLNAGTYDAVVIDSIMAGYYTNVGDFKDTLKVVPDLILAKEQYGIATRKNDKAFMSKINEAIIALNANGTMNTLAEEFGVKDSLSITAETTNPLKDAADASWDSIKTSNKIVVGFTKFAPIAFDKADAKDGLTGFDVELPRKVVEYLNTTYGTTIEIEFYLMKWDQKETLLENGTIDLIWNGLTITPEREAALCISVPYLYNNQVAVVPKDKVNDYKTKEDFKNAVIGVESGSAGQAVVEG